MNVWKVIFLKYVASLRESENFDFLTESDFTPEEWELICANLKLGWKRDEKGDVPAPLADVDKSDLEVEPLVEALTDLRDFGLRFPSWR